MTDLTWIPASTPPPLDWKEFGAYEMARSRPVLGYYGPANIPSYDEMGGCASMAVVQFWCGRHGEPYWTTFGGEEIDVEDRLTHWMPLPPPPGDLP